MPRRRPPSDAAAREAIVRDLDVSMLVEASAGSGKTTSLAERMVAMITSGRCTVDQMAAITFTRKAAAELRGKFQVELEKSIRAATDPTIGDRLSKALAHLEQVFTGTVHAFCGRLLRERPVEARVAPAFEEIDDDQDAVMLRQAWHDYIAHLHARNDSRLGKLLEADVALGDLEEAFAQICLYPEVNFPAPNLDPPDPRAAVAALNAMLTTLDRWLPGPITDETTCPLQQILLDLARGLNVFDANHSAKVARLFERCKAVAKPTYKWWSPKTKDDAQTAHALYEKFRTQVVEPYLSVWRAYLYRVALDVLLPARDAAAEARIRYGKLNYEDLLLKARDLLRDNPEVRCYFRRRFPYLFVDEFQDTDPIQAEVMLLLAGESDTERDWRRMRPRPGALFVVGDPKQSIYRFRRADIETYNHVRQLIEQGGGRIAELTRNYRSAGRLCDWANEVFRETFQDTPTPQQPAFVGLDPNRPPGDAQRTGVRTLTMLEHEDYTSVPGLEADAIARYIADAVSNGRTIEGGSADTKGPRPARYGDFLILTRVKRNIAVYAGALETRAIPYEVGGGGAFQRVGAMRMLMDLLEALANPDDEVAVVAALRGPLFGVTDDDLYRHRSGGCTFRYLTPELDAVPGPVGAALRLLASAYRLTRELPAAAAVEQILEMTGLPAWAATGESADTAAGSLHRAVDRLRLCARDGGTLADCVEGLAADLDSGNLEALGLEPGCRDVVRLMNLHKAKGLEAPVIFLADPCIGSPERADIRITRGADGPQGYLSIEKRVGEFGGRVVIARPTDWEQRAEEELQYVKAEESRLRYVAATRARDLLVIGRYHGKSRAKNPTPWTPFDEFLQTAPELEIPSLAPPAAPALPDLSPAARVAAEEGRTSKRSRAASPSFVVRAVTELSIREGPSDTRSKSEEMSRLTREPVGETGPTGKAWGILIHSMLEAAMRAQREMTDDELTSLTAFLTVDDLSLRSHLAEAVLAVRSIMASDVWQRARSSPECYTEVPFTIEVSTEDLPGQPPDSPPRTILHGVIDLVYRVEGGWEIVDYKTDVMSRADPSVLSQYGSQLQRYGQFWRKITNETVRRLGLLSVRTGETIWLN